MPIGFGLWTAGGGMDDPVRFPPHQRPARRDSMSGSDLQLPQLRGMGKTSCTDA